MKKQTYANTAVRDERLESIGMHINPPSGAKKTKKQEFFIGLIDLLIVPEMVILFIIEWAGFLAGKYLLGKDLQKPQLKKAN